MKNSCRWLLYLLVAFAPMAWAQLTLETADLGEVYFTWQGTHSSAGATSLSLSHLAAFKVAFEGNWLQSVEILEITELNTNQVLPFSYVIPSGSARNSPDLLDVTWYYPNPIPSGGNVRLLIRGRLTAESVFSGDEARIDLAYASDNQEVLFVLPVGFAVTYSSNPIIIYEKDSRTVASFPQTRSRIALTAKDARRMDDVLPPVISRESSAVVRISDLAISVVPLADEEVLTYARNRVNGAITAPVLIDALEDPTRIRSADRDHVIPGRTVIWHINDVLVEGVEGFAEINRQLAIDAEARLGVILLAEDGRPLSSRVIHIRAGQRH